MNFLKRFFFEKNVFVNTYSHHELKLIMDSIENKK